MVMNSSTEVVTNSRKKSHLVVAHNNTDDIITNLHLSVLTHILARLPTRDVFRTCILSKDWECKWTSSYNVHIDDCWWHQPSTGSFSDESFVNFMDTILISPQHRLRSFRLKCEYYQDMGRLQTWISNVLRRGVERFDLNIYNRRSILSCSLMNTHSLRTLKLKRTFKLQKWECILNVLTKNFLPNLTSLFLDGVHIVNGNANVRTVTFTFPVLETLTFRQCEWLNVESVEIYAPSLTFFKSQPKNMKREYDYSVTIVAPGLTTFICQLGLPEKIILIGSSIVSAFLHCEGPETDNIQLLTNIGFRVRNLLNTSTCMEELELSYFVANALQSRLPLRCLDKLKRLTLLQPSNARQLFELLHAAPSLKYLCINLCQWDDSNGRAMESIPSCFVSQLEEVVIRGFHHLDSEFTTSQYDVLKFFLKNADQLKKFCVVGYTTIHHKPEELREILSTFPKCSPYLTIEVAGRRRTTSIPNF